MNQRAHQSIGEVVDQLLEEFPEVTVSKVRFLEDNGLLVPERSDSGYRRYYARDIAQLRWILRLQRDQFLPLKVIRQRLHAGDFRADAIDDAPVARPRIDAAVAPEAGVELTGKEFVARTGVSSDQLAEMERYGLVSPGSRRGRPVYGGDDVVAASLVGAFAEHGIEPRHLRQFTVAAEREASLIDQRRGSLPDTEQPQATGEMVRLGRDLHAILMRRHLHR